MKLQKTCCAAIFFAFAAACVAYAAEQTPPAPPAPAQTPMFSPGMQMAPGMAQPPSVSYEDLIKAMQADAELAALNRSLTERRDEIFKTNAEVQKLRGEMREAQKKIDAILEADEKLQELKTQLESFSRPPAMPAVPQPAATE